jgi:hypothetical protein
MKLPGVPYQPRYAGDEIVLAVVLGLALHVVLAGPFVAKALTPRSTMDPDDEKPLVSRPVVQATLLKLGKPVDKSKLPDRFVPQARTAPQKTAVASQEDPGRKRDAGPPPPNAQDSDITNLITKSDPFAEDAGKRRPEEGHESGIEGGTETDPNKVKAGDMYAAKLGIFFGEHLTVPTVISVGEARRLCAVFDIQFAPNMTIFYVRREPSKSSGNELFDDAARSMLLKLLDDHVAAPAPPGEVEKDYRGRRISVGIKGDPHGDSSRCLK